MICVIGSHALNKHIPARKPIDLDLVSGYDELLDFAKRHFISVKKSYPTNKGKKWILMGPTKPDSLSNANIIETEIAWEGSSAEELKQLILDDPKSIHEGEFVYASLDVLYMLKMSHRYLRNSPHFLKTMKDIHAFRALGATIRPEHKDFYKRRMKDTYWYKHPSLMKGKKDFFSGDGVEYIVDHDAIHECIAVQDKPAYTNYQSDNAEIQCDMNKFFACSEEIRLNGVLEEVITLSIERACLPFNVPYYPAFKKALEKVCTSITSGKFRAYAYENYEKVLSMFSEEPYKKFFKEYNEGKIKSYGG